MPTPQDFNGLRGRQDRITLILGGEEVVLAEQYQVKSAILTQPTAFTVRLGWGNAVRDLMINNPPRTTFQIKINDIVYQTGVTDGYSTEGVEATLSVNGRDTLAPLVDAYVEQEFSLKNVSYVALVQKCLGDVGLGSAKLAFTNQANRIAITGGKDAQLKPPRDVQAEKIETDAGGPVKRNVQAKLGEKFYEFIRRHLDRAGLFLWSAADGSFILSEPNAQQRPIYFLFRSYSDPLRSNIVRDSHTNDTKGRYSSCRVYVRGGGKKFGRTTATGSFDDPEMKELGFTKTLVLHDVNADTPAKATYMARRKIAETRRSGWKLAYTVMGHTTSALDGSGKIAWAPDTLVTVNDDKLAMKGDFYIESVTFNSSPQATTTLELMRPEDLLFAENEAPASGGPTTPTALEFAEKGVQ